MKVLFILIIATLAAVSGFALAGGDATALAAAAIDTDGDGLSDDQEIHRYGTDPLVADTAGDSLLDGFEVLQAGTDPRRTDSDGDGEVDALEDPDGDALDNASEQIYGTSPAAADTDGDSFSDSYEIVVMGTDPTRR
jgi:hypothetical protein